MIQPAAVRLPAQRPKTLSVATRNSQSSWDWITEGSHARQLPMKVSGRDRIRAERRGDAERPRVSGLDSVPLASSRRRGAAMGAFLPRGRGKRPASREPRFIGSFDSTASPSPHVIADKCDLVAGTEPDVYAARRSYRWWSPPTLGMATTRPRPRGITDRGSGESFLSERCVRDVV